MGLEHENAEQNEEYLERLCCILNAPQGLYLNHIARLAQHVFRVPVAMLGFFNDASQCQELFGSGDLAPAEFAELAGAGDGPLQRVVVTDTRRGGLGGKATCPVDGGAIRAYATQPLFSADGIDMGAFLIADTVPRPDLCGDTVDLLADLAALVVTHIEYRITAAQILDADAEWRMMDASLRSAADTTPVLLWLTAADGCYTYLNKTWERWTGIAVEQLLRTQLSGLLHPDDESRYAEAFWDAVSRRELFSAEVRLKLRGGEYGWFLVRAAPRLSEAQEFHGLAGSFTEIASREAA